MHGSGIVKLDGPTIPGLRFRQAEPDDWPALAGIRERAHAADGVEEIQSGEALRAEWEPLERFDLGRDVMIAERDGAMVGFVVGTRCERAGVMALETWGAIAPEHRGRGIGTALHRATRRRLAAEAAADPRPGPREFRTYLLDPEVADRALVEAEGYQPIRYGFDMRRSLAGELPDHPLPPGLALRPVRPDQHRAIYEADVEAFRDHWGAPAEPDPGAFLARFASPETDTSLWCVAWDGGEVAGSVMNAIFEDENRALGVRRAWLEHVSVRRPWRGRGLAKALCAASLRHLRERGMHEARLSVDAANPTGALGLYEGLGFEVALRWYAYGRPVDQPATVGWRSAGDTPAASQAPDAGGASDARA
ncbi:MAG TPA: GNAT family N-acetyltransferase [Candidatus Limnocylindrales bacterium]|nr:GNAT family N-acetyltransferase [Candidatus Limnocylindrales bacterium]